MNKTPGTAVIGVLMQAASGRHGREQIDLPLAFASLDISVRVFVLGEACRNLLVSQQGEFAWTRLWGAAAELDVSICVARQTLHQYGIQADELPFEIVPMSCGQLAEAMAGCRHLIHV